MQQRDNKGLLIGGIIPGVRGFPLLIVGIVFKIIGTVFVSNPEGVKVEINGEILEGKEAADAALRIGNVLSKFGGWFLRGAAVLIAIAILLLVLYFNSKKQSQEYMYR